MNHFALGFALAVLLLSHLSCDTADGAGQRAVASTQPAEPIAVVELFTSEGCSSCPPADALLARLVADARQSGKRVFPLAFHVDYWNHIGWTDPFSSAANTERQRAYASAMNADSVYTPQMVVNGKEDFVGSDRAKADAAIARALKQRASAAIDLRVEMKKAGVVSVKYSVSPASERAILNIALVERGLMSRVISGENGGRQLKHENVVRTFVARPITTAGGAAEIAIPDGVKLRNSSVVAYVQNGTTMEILGASSVDLNELAAKALR